MSFKLAGHDGPEVRVRRGHTEAFERLECYSTLLKSCLLLCGTELAYPPKLQSFGVLKCNHDYLLNKLRDFAPLVANSLSFWGQSLHHVGSVRWSYHRQSGRN